jgi:hypothetical protein
MSWSSTIRVVAGAPLLDLGIRYDYRVCFDHKVMYK